MWGFWHLFDVLHALIHPFTLGDFCITKGKLIVMVLEGLQLLLCGTLKYSTIHPYKQHVGTIYLGHFILFNTLIHNLNELFEIQRPNCTIQMYGTHKVNIHNKQR